MNEKPLIDEDMQAPDIYMQAATMRNDELLSRLAQMWHNVEELRRRARYERANDAAKEYAIYRAEAIKRMDGEHGL